MDSTLGILCVFYIAVVYIEGMLICPIGWEEFDDACYFLNHAAKVDYEEAEDACNSFGAKLTTIYSMEEQSFLAGRIQDDESQTFQFYFIGLNDKELEDTFVWADGTMLDGFEYWGSEQPNNYGGTQECVGLEPRDDGKWNDIGCSSTYAYICKRGKVSDMCVNPLGMKARTINDNQITAIDMLDGFEANKARLDGEGAWSIDTMNTNRNDHWIQVDFGTLRYVSGLVTQGNPSYNYRVTRYTVEYSNGGLSSKFVTDDERMDAMIFYGNSDRSSYVTSLFPSTVPASRIRIYPTAWNNMGRYITMRFEILGCEVSDMCLNPFGMKDGTIQDNQITASSEYDEYSKAHFARLEGEGAWDADVNNQSQWIQVDFGTIRSVSGIVTQGHKTYDQWVTRYSVEYGRHDDHDDGHWQYVKDVDQPDKMIFRGNSDKGAYVTSLFPSPVIASRIRIRPIDWNTQISMRFELLGCEAIAITTLGTTPDLVSTDLRGSQSSLVVTAETNIPPKTDTETADSKLPRNQKSNITGTAIGVTLGFVFLLVVIGCIIYFCKRRKQQDSSQLHTVLQLDGPYGDTVTNDVTSQPKEDANTSEGVDHANTGASQILDKEDHGELYQEVPDRPGDIPVDHEDTYQDVRDAPTNSTGANDDIYHDIRDAEYDYARVDKKRLIQVPNDDSDHTTSHVNDASRSGEANQQDGWVDNDIYGRSDEEQPKRQDDEDSNTEGWEDNSIYAT